MLKYCRPILFNIGIQNSIEKYVQFLFVKMDRETNNSTCECKQENIYTAKQKKVMIYILRGKHMNELAMDNSRLYSSKWQQRRAK